MEERAFGAGGDLGGGAVAVVAGEIIGGERDHQEMVVLSMLLGGVGHGRQTSSLRTRFPSATEQVHPVDKAVTEREASAVDPGLHGTERDAGHLGDLGVVVALDVE